MESTEERVKVKILKNVLGKSELRYAKDALDYINILEKQLAIYSVSISETELCGICKQDFRIVTGKICEHKECVRYR